MSAGGVKRKAFGEDFERARNLNGWWLEIAQTCANAHVTASPMPFNAACKTIGGSRLPLSPRSTQKPTPAAPVPRTVKTTLVACARHPSPSIPGGGSVFRGLNAGNTCQNPKTMELDDNNPGPAPQPSATTASSTERNAVPSSSAVPKGIRMVDCRARSSSPVRQHACHRSPCASMAGCCNRVEQRHCTKHRGRPIHPGQPGIPQDRPSHDSPEMRAIAPRTP